MATAFSTTQKKQYFVAGSVLDFDNSDVTITASADLLTIAGGGLTVAGTVTFSTVLGAASGGTGNSAYTVGDLLYASGAAALARLASVATGNVLLAGGVSTAMSWGKVDLAAHVSGFLPAANGGTGLSSAGASGVVSINAGTWNWSGDIPTNRVLFMSTNNVVSHNANLTFDGNLTLNLGSGFVFNWNASDVTLTHTANTLTLAGGDLVQRIGTGTATGKSPIVWDKQTSGSGVGNGADTTHDTLFTIPTLPAATLAENGDRIEISVSLITASNGNNKQLGVTFQGTSYTTPNLTDNNSKGWPIVLITRVDATHVNIFFFMNRFDGASWTASLNQVVNNLDTNTSTLLFTGASPTTGAANDVVAYDMVTTIYQ